MIYGNDVFGYPRFIDPNSTVVLPSADVIGDVIVGSHVFIACFASIRADEGAPFVICKGCNVQDHVIMHGFFESYVELNEEEKKCIGVDIEKCSIYVGSHTTLAHRCTLHGPVKIGKKSFIGFGSQVICSTIGKYSHINHSAKVLNSGIGERCVVGHDAYVEGVRLRKGVYVPPRSEIVTQKEADRLKQATEEIRNRISNAHIVDLNKTRLREGYIDTIKKI